MIAKRKFSTDTIVCFLSPVLHHIRDVDTGAEVARRIAAIPGRVLGLVRRIVGVTDQSRSLDRSLPRGRRRSRRNQRNPTRKRRKKVRALG